VSEPIYETDLAGKGFAIAFQLYLVEYRVRENDRVPPPDRARANMEAVLDETCRSLPHGGNDEIRAFIAHRLADAVQIGLNTLGELGIVARKAVADYSAGRLGSVTIHARIVDLRGVDVNPSPDDEDGNQ
jgi:hypothetical protein